MAKNENKAEQAAREKARANPVKVSVVQQVQNDERTRKLDELLELDEQLLEVESEKKSAANSYGNRIKEINKARKGIMDVVKNGVERVEIDAYTLVDGTQVRTYRLSDDKELTDRVRALTPEESQMSIEDMVNLPPGDAPEGDDDPEDEDEDESDEEEDAAE